MELTYKSTRDGSIRVTSSQAILQGLAPDGGLFVPERLPAFPLSFEEMAQKSYQELAFELMRLLLTDFTEEELRDAIQKAYDEKFDTALIAPLVKKDGVYYLELYHGATAAFKDMALSILPHLMTIAAKKNQIQDEIVILTATSGDTGKAAMAGFADVPGTKIIVFYPKGGVSMIQEKQMLTQRGANVHVVGIRGNFDDAQTGVKKIFGDAGVREKLASCGLRFSSANSINIGRLVPQIVYYFYAYGQLIRQNAVKAGDPFHITVPTGNFGNILAAYYAREMGLPVEKLLCASNENKVLVDFFSSGLYDRKREFILTSSPSMDILISSNLERLIYKIAGEDCEVTRALMADLQSKGEYQITPEMKRKLDVFYGNFASQEETKEEIAALFRKEGYVIDTHTAVASRVYRTYREKTGDHLPVVIASTASPYKFARAVLSAIAPDRLSGNDLDLCRTLFEVSGQKVPRTVEEISSLPNLHDTVVDVPEMEGEILRWLGI